MVYADWRSDSDRIYAFLQCHVVELLTRLGIRTVAWPDMASTPDVTLSNTVWLWACIEDNKY